MTWSVFFLVPTGRGLTEDEITPQDYEAVMNFLYDASKYIGIKTTEGHHFKRIVLQRAYLEANGLPVKQYIDLNGTYDELMKSLHRVAPLPPTHQNPDRIRRTPLHVNAGDGFVFISLLGEVFPSGYLPVSAGNVRKTPLSEVYQLSPLFQSLRNKERLKGRCGKCEFNPVCGGSRSRAYAMTGDALAEEPYCSYQPGTFPFSHEIPELSGA
jgi:radical SAM protein with 4Fe4S-binding SPASM domain